MMESPGSIRYQVGLSVSKIRECIDNRDVDGFADHLEYLITVSSPKLTPEEMRELALPERPDMRRDKTGTRTQGYFRELNEVQRRLLRYLSQKQLYAYQEPAAGDGSSLVEKPEDVDPEVVRLDVQ